MAEQQTALTTMASALSTAVASSATDAAASASPTMILVPQLGTAGYCDGGNAYDDSDLGVRVSSIFVILVGSLIGAMLPIISKNKSFCPPVVFFVAKYFGSGVIVATAFIHLLAPANEELGDECLTGPITEYPWAEGIALMTVFMLFFVELIVMRSGMFDEHKDDQGQTARPQANLLEGINGLTEPSFSTGNRRKSSVATPARGEEHLGHQHDHRDLNPADGISTIQEGKKLDEVDSQHDHDVEHGSYDDYSAQMTAIFILEFGVIFHSVFIGLTLAVTEAGNPFSILYVVLVFHQTFEGMGLGTRLAITPWKRDFRGRMTPYILAVGYALATPLSIAIGLGVRYTFQPGSQTALLVTGIFDSISAGILLYTGLVELMAHEFMFSRNMQNSSTWVMLAAFVCMCFGAGLMALLGKWA